jgi:hypothetical protein
MRKSVFFFFTHLYQHLISVIADLENQSAHRLAARFDPHGSRTIGMLIDLLFSVMYLISVA